MRPGVAMREQAARGLAEMVSEARRRYGMHVNTDDIPADMTFRQWCEKLAAAGLQCDGHPFSLQDRPALHFIYDLIPTHRKDAFKRKVIVQKAAQVGMTIWEMLADIYMAIKWEPLSIGLYVPDRTLAAYKSSHRFMPVLRTVPMAYKRLLTDPVPEDVGGHARKTEGNVMTRVLRNSRLLFLWTSGKVATESVPLDIVSYDEVQEMLISEMEKVMERMSASDVRFSLMLSTANWPDADINHFYKTGTQHRFHTDCQCPGGVILDDAFPDCIRLGSEVEGAPADEYVYVCPKCKTYIPDTQQGQWVPDNPSATDISVHLPQTLSRTISAEDLITSFQTAQDLKNFYNRKLGKPWTDPSQQPVTLEVLNRCVAAGQTAGLVWEKSGKDTFMGIDQMGAFNVAIVKRRLPDGRQAVCHIEAIYADDPFARCDELMAQYGVSVCVVETLPNYNDAKRFANRHPRRVFLASYTDMAEDMMRWGDAQFTRADRRTAAAERDRFTVVLDQYKCMQVAMMRFVNGHCLFPDPSALVQTVKDKGIIQQQAICRDMVFLHLTKTALVVEKDEEQHKMRRKVVKVGIDPHFSYANMLCDVAWARSFGTAQFVLPDEQRLTSVQEKVAKANPGLPAEVIALIQDEPGKETCGGCVNMRQPDGWCPARNFFVRKIDPACPLYEAKA